MTEDDFGIKSELDDMVADPDKGIVYLHKMKENELLDLLVRLASKAKRIKTRHWERHGYLLDMGKVLEKMYSMNTHRWGLDMGKNAEELEAFERRFKDKLFGDFHKTNQLILELMRKKESEMKLQKKIVLDENMSVSDKELANNPELSNTKHKVGPGATDEKILELAKKEGWTIVTKDKKFTLDLLIEGLEVWYHDSRGERHKLKLEKID